MWNLLRSKGLWTDVTSASIAAFLALMGSGATDVVKNWIDREPISAQLSWVYVPNPFFGHPERFSNSAEFLQRQLGLLDLQAPVLTIGSVFITNKQAGTTTKTIVVNGNMPGFLDDNLAAPPAKQISIPLLAQGGNARVTFIGSAKPSFRVEFGDRNIKVEGWDDPHATDAWGYVRTAAIVVIAGLLGALTARLIPFLPSAATVLTRRLRNRGT